MPRWSFALAITIWLCFLARGLFYCSFIPLWEGYDEWAHFAYVERLVTTGQLLVDREDRVSREVERSLQLAPVPWELRELPKPSITQDDYWKLSPDERIERQQQLKTIPDSWSSQPDPLGKQIYEALQPPLYYWLTSVPYRMARSTSLSSRAFLLRYISLGVASLCVPLIFLIAYRVLGNATIAACTSTLLVVMPELMVDVCRVGNECLGIVLYSLLILLCLDLTNDSVPWRTVIFAGIVLGLGLLTKAYFLTAVPALGALFAWRILMAKQRRVLLRQAVMTFGIALFIAGWWYIHNRVTTRTWSGLSESVMLREYGWRQFLNGAWRVEWERAIDAILMSHVWFGGWSSLVVRSWMYHFLFLVAAIATVGVAAALWRPTAVRRPSLYPLLAFYGFFWIGQLYNVLLLFLSKGVSTSMGWYMYCVVAAEVTLLVVGLQSLVPMFSRKWAIPVLVLCVAALDVYTIHFVSIPYYTGFISHRPNGFVASFHLSQLHEIGLAEVLTRLSANKPIWLNPRVFVAVWLGYIAATLTLIVLPFWLTRIQRNGLK